MLIQDVVNAGSMPALEATIRFAAQRQRILASNIANAETPDYRPLEVSVAGFQKELGRAIDQRRRTSGGELGPLSFKDTREIKFNAGGQMVLTPSTPTGNVLFHDRNNRDVERMMQDLAENVGAFRMATDLLKSRFDLMKSAIAQRP